MAIVVATLAFVVGLATAAAAKLMDVSLDELVATADLIVVVRVTALASEHDRTVASADVLETIRGTAERPGGRVRFIASHTYAEDYSAARVGEVAMLFLVHRCGPGTAATRWYTEEAPTSDAAPSELPCIAARGRGRFLRIESAAGTEWTPHANLIVYPASLWRFLDRDREERFPDRPFRDAITNALPTPRS